MGHLSALWHHLYDTVCKEGEDGPVGRGGLPEGAWAEVKGLNARTKKDSVERVVESIASGGKERLKDGASRQR